MCLLVGLTTGYPVGPVRLMSLPFAWLGEGRVSLTSGLFFSKFRDFLLFIFGSSSSQSKSGSGKSLADLLLVTGNPMVERSSVSSVSEKEADDRLIMGPLEFCL